MGPKYKIQDFTVIPLDELVSTAATMKIDGYRFGQACASKNAQGLELLYSFDKDHVLKNYKVMISGDEVIPSISDSFWSAFIYENEMHDLFGVKFNGISVDFDGHFYKLSIPRPWNPETPTAPVVPDAPPAEASKDAHVAAPAVHGTESAPAVTDASGVAKATTEDGE